MGLLKKWIIQIHQILGTILCLAFVVWFLSGFVMIFSGFPHASETVQFKTQQPLTPQDSIAPFTHNPSEKLSRLTLEKIHHIPVYRFMDQEGKMHIRHAKTLEPIDTLQESVMDAVIAATYQQPVDKKEIITDFDQWIPWSHFSQYFPIHKYYLDDEACSIVYISARTGTIVQETTQKQRVLASFGAIPHWYYFKSLRLQRAKWIRVVVWISGIGCIMSLTGIITGIIRYRKRRKQKKWFGFSPYNRPWYKWHHVVGFIFGLFVFTFVFSGMMSLLQVPQWIIPVKKEVNHMEQWNRTPVNLRRFNLPAGDILTKSGHKDIKRIAWHQLGHDPYYHLYTDNLHKPVIIPAQNRDTIKVKKIGLAEIKNELHNKYPDVNITTQLLHEPDSYFSRDANSTAPVLKAVMDDADKTWLYIDMTDGKIVKVLNRSSRVRRWLYNGLHSFDFGFFVHHEPVRKLFLVILCVFGSIISISGLVLGYFYLRNFIRRNFLK